MRNSDGCRVVTLITPALFVLFPVAVVTFVLDRVSSTLLFAQTGRYWCSGAYDITLYVPNSTGSDSSTNIDVTLMVNQASSLAILGIAIVAYVVSALDVFGIWGLRRVEGTTRHQRGWIWAVVVGNIIMIGATLGVFVYASSVQVRDKGWKTYDNIGSSEQKLTRETWACQIDAFFPAQS